MPSAEAISTVAGSSVVPVLVTLKTRSLLWSPSAPFSGSGGTSSNTGWSASSVMVMMALLLFLSTETPLVPPEKRSTPKVSSPS